MAAPATYFATALDDIKADLARRGVEVFDFGVGDPVEPTPAFIRQALIDALDPVSQYPTVVGQRRLREAIAGWAQRRLGVELDADSQVLPASGSKEAIFHLPLALLGPDERRRRIVYPSPSYPVYEGSARFANAIAHAVVLREDSGFRLDLGSLGRAVLEETRIAWLNYPHNPSGASVDLAYLQAQVEVARDYDILLCGDDCYLDLYFPDEPPPPGILQLTQTGVLSVGSLSKRSGMTGYRSGYIAGDASVISLLKKARPNFGVASQNFVQAAAAAAWSDDAHVAQRRAIFGAKRERLVSFLTRRGYTVTGSQGAIYVWARVPDGLGRRFFEKLLERGIVVSPGES
ncbi:MAG TPA: aminotransferase class I/II-fold pyridoxal phosphate-dependent enzyme, partial [Chloroflexota bacterium]|nr:aminotransferase class I/II-fold pyridoxal phosphate-dependent enzyme [Chloroflexota bacterium]